MIERTAFDLRIAAHESTTATINATEWRRQGTGSQRRVRVAVAAALLALARRLAPATVAPEVGGTVLLATRG